ncbi:hypothetical protein ACFLVN_04890 [Chloroflexota bacterium]
MGVAGVEQASTGIGLHVAVDYILAAGQRHRTRQNQIVEVFIVGGIIGSNVEEELSPRNPEVFQPMPGR